jgi:hypothetical protein
MLTNRWLICLYGLVILLSIASQAFGHHGSGAYDMTKMITVTGTVTDVQFINPHVLISLQSRDDAGKLANWQGELTSPNHLARFGWTRNTVKVGDQVTFSGGQAKSGATIMWIRKIVKNGQEISVGAGGDN